MPLPFSFVDADYYYSTGLINESSHWTFTATLISRSGLILSINSELRKVVENSLISRVCHVIRVMTMECVVQSLL